MNHFGEPMRRCHSQTSEAPDAYRTDREIRCSFFSLVVRRDSLDERYTGGTRAFVRQHHGVYNDDILVIGAMGFRELDGPIEDLLSNGLQDGPDYVVFDAMTFGPPGHVKAGRDDAKISMGVDWLEGRASKGRTLVKRCANASTTRHNSRRLH